MARMIGNLIFLLMLTTYCIVLGIYEFKQIYPTRYGKNHIEIDGKIVGIKRVMSYGGSLKCPILEFYYQNKRYEIVDTTYVLWNDNKIGEVVKIYFDPDYNENIAIIKRGKFSFGTLIWLYYIVMGILCMLLAIIVIVWLLNT